ncbi:MAG TPA: DUF507 domain-containing protein [Solibacterales bacterium]|nr:DUF507 domain-containing protein [Bryobacterales bacterium]
MLIAKEFVTYLARQLAKRLTPLYVETADANATTEFIASIIVDELEVEDRLNDEVRDILSQYEEYMRREGVSYQEMFRRIKNTLVAQRKVVRAAGRDTGDAMKLSRDKINEVSHKIITGLRANRQSRLKKDPNEVRLEIFKGISEILTAEDKADRDARKKIRTQKREIPEGSEEWDILHKRYYAEELKKLGIDLNAR